ncbi:tRNA methyltransferase 10 homolog C [Hyperolius riggenbachi]|uniref:tRNA methyltransferase 10 homolog C n=1 Tax=Hyperolius riggenbachi TaxID=752182 RepID=UPI0035A37022
MWRAGQALGKFWKMAFLNSVLQTVKFLPFPILLRQSRSKPTPFKVTQQLSQCRMLTLTHYWWNQDKPETLNLDSWKNILRSGTKITTDEKEAEVQGESSIESMQKLVEMWRLAGKPVPDSVTAEQLQVLLTLSSKNSRVKYLKELFLKENRKKSMERKKLEKLKLKSEMEKDKPERISTYLLKFYTTSVACFQGWRAAQAMIHGQPLIFDMAYDGYMSQKEMENTVSQLMICEGFNRKSDEPFHVHFCNLEPNGRSHKELVNRYKQAWDNLLVTSTEKSHVDIFPRDRLVYLTSDSPNVLKEFDHDKIYIIGAFVDKCQKTGVSLGHAKRLQLATARLPLDNFLKWDMGGKNLTLDQMISIMMTLKDTGDWEKALSYVPIRKHLGFMGKCTPQNSKSQQRKEARGNQEKMNNSHAKRERTTY